MANEVVVIDEHKMLESIQSFPNLLTEGWTTVHNQELRLPDLTKISRVLILGMGGSGITGDLVGSAAPSKLAIDYWNDYQLPAWADESTFVIASSYSGNTEETLDALKLALERKCPVLALGQGGKLEELAAIHGFSLIKIKFNGPPRASLGEQFGVVLGLLTKAGVLEFSEEQFKQALAEVTQIVESKQFLGRAEDLAVKLNNKLPVLMAHRPLLGVIRRWQCQFNENAKTSALLAPMPESTHNLIVGLDFPIPEKLSVLYLESAYGYSRNTARVKIIEKLINNKHISFTPLSLKSGSPLAEQWLLAYFGDLLSYYLAGINGVDPTPIDSIVYFKDELKKL